MKKSFFLGVQFAGLMLLGGLTVVGCYEGDNDAVDYTAPSELPDAKYKLYCAVANVEGNALDGATVTVSLKKETKKEDGSVVVEPQTQTLDTENGGCSFELGGPGLCSVEVKKDGYVTVKKSAYMAEVGKGSIGILNFDVVLKKTSEVSSFGEPVGSTVTNATKTTKDEIARAVQESVAKAVVEGAKVNGEVKSEIIKSMVDGESVDVVRVTVPLKLIDNTTEKAPLFYVPRSKGYVYNNVKAVRATDSLEEEWVRQANAFFGVEEPGFKQYIEKLSFDNAGGRTITGYKVVQDFIARELTFECGADLEEYTGTVQYAAESYVVTPVFANDIHDDHHGDGGSYGGGTTSRD